jgi:hypothetical protein
MSGKDIGLEGYEPGGGFQPAKLGISRGELKYLLVLAAILEITHLLRSYLGNPPTIALMGIAYGAAFAAIGARQILKPERWKSGTTEKGARRLRIGGIVSVVLGTAGLTLAIRSLVFLAEGW